MNAIKNSNIPECSNTQKSKFISRCSNLCKCINHISASEGDLQLTVDKYTNLETLQQGSYSKEKFV